MKQLRKWSRILHRDIGYFFFGTTFIYALSGLALNHINDWNPNYTVSNKTFTTDISLQKDALLDEHVAELAKSVAPNIKLKKYYFPETNYIKIFLSGGSSIVVNTDTGQGRLELLQKRLVFYQANYLHYNPSKWWTWFSDLFAVALIILAITSFFMVRGKKGMSGRGGVYTALGFLVPILFLIFLLN